MHKNIKVIEENKAILAQRGKSAHFISSPWKMSIFNKTDKRMEYITYEILIFKMPIILQIILNILKIKATNDWFWKFW